MSKIVKEMQKIGYVLGFQITWNDEMITVF